MNDSQTLQQQAIEIMEIIEEVVENYCDDNMVSGEKVWVMIRALSDYKLTEFSFSPDIDFEGELEEEGDNEDWTNNIDPNNFVEDD